MKRIVVVLALGVALLAPSSANAAGISVTFTSFRNPVGRNHEAYAAVHTKPGARCDIDVMYSTGESSARGLGNKTANSSGNVSWTWKVGAATKLGYWPVRVTCSKSGNSAQKTKKLHVVR